MERRFFSDNMNEIFVNYNDKNLIINCIKVKTNGRELVKIISDCVMSINNVLIKDFIKHESYCISLLSNLEECETVVNGGIPESRSALNMKDCDIKFDLVFKVKSGIITFDTIKNITK